MLDFVSDVHAKLYVISVLKENYDDPMGIFSSVQRKAPSY
jgi:hypothetical protein